MSIYKPKRSPYWHFDIQWQGHRIFGSTGCAKREDALAVAAAKRRALVLGEHYPERRRMTLDVALGRYWSEVAQSQSSAKTAWGYLERLAAGLGKATMLDELDGGKLADYIATARGRRIASAKPKAAKLVAPATVNREIECLRRVLNRARVVWEVETPALNWRALLLREPDPKIVPLPSDADEKLIAAAAPHLRPAIRFALLTGVRLQNAVKLDWRQIDLERRLIRFQVKSKRPGGRALILPISDAVRALLGTLEPKDVGPVFLYWRMKKGKRGPARPIATTWRTAWKGALRRAGLDGYRWHDLRHTFATRLLQAGVGMRGAKELLGHADYRSTERYQHYDLDDKRRALEMLESGARPRMVPEPTKRARRK